MVCFRCRVVDDQVGVVADGHGALALEAEQPGRRRRDDLDEPVRRDPPAHDAAVVDEVDPVLDAREAVRDLPEVAPAHLLLAVEVERAVVGPDEREVALDEALPELLLVASGRVAERRRAHELRALEPVAQVVQREEQVLRAGLGERRQALVLRPPEGVERLPGRHVDEVDRAPWPPGPAGSPGSSPRPRRSSSGRGHGRSGRSCPSATSSAATTSMTGPFSACMRIRPPFLAVCLRALKIASSPLRKTPG